MAIIHVVALEGVLLLVESDGLLLDVCVLLLGLLERNIEVVRCHINKI
jgi:hypothetical protein